MDPFHNQFIHDGNQIYQTLASDNHDNQMFIANRRPSADVVMPNVFVTIPMQSQSHAPPHTSASTSANSNSNEIKSEPIKLEISERAAAIASAEVTSPRVTSTLNGPSLVTARPKKSVICFKCEKCPFISLSQSGLSSHENECHKSDETDEEAEQQVASRKLLCPGCENVFYTKKSLETHLANDHQMNENEIETLIESLEDGGEEEALIGEETISKAHADSGTGGQKIFIKNVDNLKEPPLPPLTQRPKSKIYIKNVDILKNPIYLHPPPAQVQIRPPPPMSISPAEPITMDDDHQSFMSEFPNIQHSDIIDLNSNSNSNIESAAHHDFFHPITLDCDHRHRTISGSSSLHLRTVDELNLLNFNDMHNLMTMATSTSTRDDNQLNDEVVILDEYNIIPELIDSDLETHLNGYHQDFELNQNNSANNIVFLSELLQDQQQQQPAPLDSCEIKDGEDDGGQNLNVENFFFSPHDANNDNDDGAINEQQNAEADMAEQHATHNEDMLYVCAEEIINEPQLVFLSEILNNQDNNEEEEDNNGNELMISENTFAIEENATESNNAELLEVAENAEAPLNDLVIDESTATTPKAHGRPKGAKQSGITRLKKMYEHLTPTEIGHKCSMAGCAMRFRSKDILDYHVRCHSPESAKIIICPECVTAEFRNWNSLHTHLWRDHLIDMELFACELCDFKTPILSRLNNTHIKIHSNERNFKCDICLKGFKNTKQLKNHRRIHRTVEQIPAHNCAKCNATFTNPRALKKHMDRHHSEGTRETFRCDECGRVAATKEGLKLHVLTHKDDKKFVCDKEKCFYATNDHNAFRRHKMKHNELKNYQCPYCEYTSIQSTTFKNHILKNHSSKAMELVFQCSSCNFVTINKQKFEIHQTRHTTPTQFLDQQTVIQINETPPPTLQSDERIPTTSSSSDDLILLAPPPSASTVAASHHPMDFLPLIRPAIFANNFSNIENMRFLPPFFNSTPAPPLETVDASVIAANHQHQYGCDNISFNIDLT